MSCNNYSMSCAGGFIAIIVSCGWEESHTAPHDRYFRALSLYGDSLTAGTFPSDLINVTSLT